MIPSVDESDFSRLSVLYHINYFSLVQILRSCFMGPSPLHRKCIPRVGALSTALFDRVKSLGFRLINSFPLTVFSLLKFSAMLLALLYLSCMLFEACQMPSPTHLRSHAGSWVTLRLHSLISFTTKLCNSLSSSVSPPSFDFNTFKRRVSR